MTARPHPRVAIVTGAARGIGAAVARRLAAEGCVVVCVDRAADDPDLPYPLGRHDELAVVAEACGGEAVVADVRDPAELQAAVALAEDRHGGVDVVVAAAGVVAGGVPTWELDEAIWAVNIDVNLTGVWRTAAATVPALLRRPAPRQGLFVAIASAAATGGHPRLGAYVAAKHGVLGLVRSMAVELGGEGVTVNAVCPGSTDTAALEASRDVYGLGDVGEFAEHHVVGRLLDPTEIASAVAWLASVERSGVTGTALVVDGGMTL